MYNFDKMAKKPLGARIEDELMHYILQEPVEPGQKIPNEFELAEKFGVGRSTIREAVKGLVSRGILEVRRGSGTYVINTSSLDEDPLGLGKIEDKYKLALDLFDVRLMIEPEIAGLACRNATEEDLKRLKRLCDETERLYVSGSNHISKDIEFHTCIARCSKNQVVETLVPVKRDPEAGFRRRQMRHDDAPDLQSPDDSEDHGRAESGKRMMQTSDECKNIQTSFQTKWI